MSKNGTVPNSSGWSVVIPPDSGTHYVCLDWSSEYHPEGNYSIITVKPYYKAGANYGSDIRFYSGGIYGNSSSANLYSCSDNFGSGNRLTCSGSTSWTRLYPNNGSIATFRVNHNSNGVATFTLGMYGKLYIGYYRETSAPFGNTSVSVTITESAPYVLSYDANGGSGEPSSQSVYAGVSYTIPSTVPVREGRTFVGWSTDSSAVSATYQPGDNITPNGNVTLYAVWKLNTYTLSFSQDEGSSISVVRRGEPLSDGASVTYGDVLIISVSPNIGYNISGLTVNGSQFISGSSYTVESAVVVVSSSTVKQFTISITEGTGTLVTVVRTYSPLGGAALVELSDGDTIYHSDVLSITVSTTAGYILQEVTMNGGSIQTPYSVSMDVVIVATAIAAGAYIKGGSTFEMYQMLIKGQSDWDLYRPTIYTGNSWENY